MARSPRQQPSAQRSQTNPNRVPQGRQYLRDSYLPVPGATPFKPMGVSGTAVYRGVILSRERSPKWNGLQKYITIADMAVNTSIIAAGIRYTSGLVAHPRWSVTPADENDPKAKAAAELVEECLHDLDRPWSHVVRRAYMKNFYGFSLAEWTAKKRPDGSVGLASVEPRPQFTIEQWATDPTGAVTGVYQRAPKTGQLLGIARNKLLYLADDIISDSPEGTGVFRHLAEPWERLKGYYDLEARAFERDLRGIPIGRVPMTLLNEAVANGKLKQTDADAMVKAMSDFVALQAKQSDTGLTVDSMPYLSEAQDGLKVAGVPQWGIELLQGSGQGMADIAASIKRTQFEMATVMCCQQLLYGLEGASGNRALSRDMSQNLYLMANAALSDLTGAVDRDIVDPICVLNNIPEEIRPKTTVEDVAFKDAESVASVLAKMAQAGAMLAPDDPVVAETRELMGLSPPQTISPEMAGLVNQPSGTISEADAADSLDAEAQGTTPAGAGGDAPGPVAKKVKRVRSRRSM